MNFCFQEKLVEEYDAGNSNGLSGSLEAKFFSTFTYFIDFFSKRFFVFFSNSFYFIKRQIWHAFGYLACLFLY